MSTSTAGLVSLFGHDPATYRRTRSTPASAPTTRPTATRTSSSSCSTPAATSRSRRWASRSALDFEGDQWTFFKPHPADLELLFGVDIHEMQPYRPLPVQIAELIARGPDDDGRARRLVPARHRGHELSPRAREDLGRGRGDRPRRGAAPLLPQRVAVRARGRGLPRRLPPRPRCSGRRAAAVHRAGPLRRRASAGRATELQGAARERLRGHLDRGRARRTRSSASAGSSPIDLPACSTATSRDYHAYAFATVRMAGGRVRALRRPRRLAAGRSGCAGVGGDGGDRRRLASVLGFKLARRRPFDPSEALGGPGVRVGPGDERARRGRTLTPCRSRSPPWRHRVDGHDIRSLDHGWEAAVTDGSGDALDLAAGATSRAPPRASFVTRASRSATTSTARTGGSGPRSRPPRRAAARRSCSASTASPPLAEVFLNGEPIARQRVDVRGARRSTWAAGCAARTSW